MTDSPAPDMERGPRGARAVRATIDRLLERLLIVLLSLLVIDVLWQVVSRFAGSPSSFTDELARFLFIWVGLLGAAYATGKRLHLAIDLLPRQVQPATGRKLRRLINVVVLVFSGLVLVLGGLRLVIITLKLNQLSPTMEIPLGYVYLAVPLAGVLMMYYTAADIVQPPEIVEPEPAQPAARDKD